LSKFGCPQPEASAGLSQSQRALYRANGNAVPVTPERAKVRVEASSVRRSAAMPRVASRFAQSHGNRAIPDSSSGLPEDNTLRTIDLIEQFPAPPDRTLTLGLPRTPVQAPDLFICPRHDQEGEDGEAASTSACRRQKLRDKEVGNTPVDEGQPGSSASPIRTTLDTLRDRLGTNDG
jgi:hypothetical protein